MVTRTDPLLLSDRTVQAPALTESLWMQFPVHGREPRLCVLSRIVARQLQAPVTAKEAAHEDREPN